MCRLLGAKILYIHVSKQDQMIKVTLIYANVKNCIYKMIFFFFNFIGEVFILQSIKEVTYE